MYRSTFGVETSLMSLLWFLTQVRAAGGVQKLLEATEGTAQEFTLEEGAGEPSAVTSAPMSPTVQCTNCSGAIIQHLAAEVGEQARILLGQPVTKVEQRPGQRGQVIVRTAGGRNIK